MSGLRLRLADAPMRRMVRIGGDAARPRRCVLRVVGAACFARRVPAARDDLRTVCLRLSSAASPSMTLRAILPHPIPGSEETPYSALGPIYLRPTPFSDHPRIVGSHII
ncbi:hypothetical protein C8J57DRAFT_1539384 [Mycena rebaudengoi]|nr:hypothetical protein C8J57DRAFT_1539384 [Mycena rebaudengoi]